MKTILKKLSELYYALFYSFDATPDTGFDPRKITAWAIVALAAYSHINFVDQSVVIEALSIDYIFISILLGVVTVEQYLRFKQGSQNNDVIIKGENNGTDGEQTPTS